MGEGISTEGSCLMAINGRTCLLKQSETSKQIDDVISLGATVDTLPQYIQRNVKLVQNPYMVLKNGVCNLRTATFRTKTKPEYAPTTVIPRNELNDELNERSMDSMTSLNEKIGGIPKQNKHNKNNNNSHHDGKNNNNNEQRRNYSKDNGNKKNINKQSHKQNNSKDEYFIRDNNSNNHSNNNNLGENVVRKADHEAIGIPISNLYVSGSITSATTDSLLESKLDAATGEQLKAKVVKYKHKVENLRRDKLCGLLKADDMHEQMQHICDIQTKNSWLVSADMDKMKDLNENYGKIKVDEIITQIGNILKQFESNDCTPYRKYDKGDEFFLVFTNTLWHEVLAVATALMEKVQQNTKLATISIGVAVHTHSEQCSTWETRAETQMKLAKKNYGNCVFYNGININNLIP